MQIPEELARAHPVFYISQLRKCLQVPDETVLPEVVDLQETLEYVEYPVKIQDQAENETRRTTISYCKVLWSNHGEATWQKEADLFKGEVPTPL